MGTYKLCLLKGVLLLPHLKLTTRIDKKSNQFQFYGNEDKVEYEANKFLQSNPYIRFDFVRMHKCTTGDKVMGFIPFVSAEEMEESPYGEFRALY